ncbi:hypothetical protein LCGC14_0869830 [marine sediment metagenome]|uniref:PhoU domain-containing protein n=1 Tax=marine sediment metagenome TaxID=412755 RepID=A0A0F9RPN0_9ZZZZ
MSKGTRNYINQWIIKSSNHIELTLFNLDRIQEAVLTKGEYVEIIDNTQSSAAALLLARQHIINIQRLLNDPRANKIEV